MVLKIVVNLGDAEFHFQPDSAADDVQVMVGVFAFKP